MEGWAARGRKGWDKRPSAVVRGRGRGSRRWRRASVTERETVTVAAMVPLACGSLPGAEADTKNGAA